MGLFDWARRSSSARNAKAATRETRVQQSPAPGPALSEEDQVRRGIDLLGAGKFLQACDAFRAALALNPRSAANNVNLAYALQQIDAETDALPHLRKAVLLDPQSFDAQYMLGAALERVPDLPGAAKHFSEAVALRPDFETARADLCRVLALGGDTVAARAAIVAATELNPDSADFHYYLGNLCMAEKSALAAVESYSRALALKPDYAQVHANMGLALVEQGKLDQAIGSFERAVAIEPSSCEFHTKLGLAFKAQRRFGEAAQTLQRALGLDPDNAEVHNELGIVLTEQGLPDQAVDRFRKAIALRPELPGAYANLGLALYERGDVAKAITVYCQGLAIKPLAETHDNLAIALQKQGAVDEAIEHFQMALELRPENLNTRCNLAAALYDAGRPQEAIAAYREILRLRPEHLIAHSNLLCNLSVDENISPEDYLAEARRFNAKLTQQPLQPVVSRPDETRRLRIGFVSGDLRIHPVGFFLEGILQHIDTSRLELFAYSTTPKEDELTARIKPRFARWQVLKGLSDEAAARVIRADGVDILLDLAGHTGDNRLAVFGFRPAPVQISWLGFFASTGVSAIDYLFADDACVPPGCDSCFTERVWRLPQTRMCYTPPSDADAPEVSELPALKRGHITFGCFQRLPKLTDAVLDLWGRVFEAMPNARLLMQSHQTGRPIFTEQILARLAAVGISAERVTIRGPAIRNAYLQSYSEVDIVLDTFPYTGGTTTCEALWMGVPTVTLTGASMIARQGDALLGAAGLQDWVAQDPAEYVRKAVAFGTNVAELALLRASMRKRIQATPLFDVRLFARRLEDALASIWREHLSQAPRDAAAPL